ncbi:MAG: hypothetical protein KAT17_00380, partial [Candidatus Aminicenantes bacterium]|nr:hypothetical protein [Candidatus Aminicenantes bacterium]
SSTAAIVSPAAVQKYRQKFYQNPVGTGAFMFKSWEKKKRIVLVANPNYWRGKPAIDEFVSITSDKHEILHKLFRQEKIDIIDSVSISRTAGLKNLRWATIKLIPTLSVTFIAFNFKNKNLKKENIRKAIRFAWDPRFLKYVFQDFVVPINSILPRGMPGYKTEMRTKNFFINKARELVEKENITGVIKLRFLLLNDSSLERQIVSLFSKNLKRIGIELELESVSREKYKKRIGSGDFDLTFSGWIADYPDPHSIISPLFNDQLQEKGFANLSQYKDASIKAQIESIASEVNTPKRIKKVAGIIKGVYDHVLCIPIFQDTTVIVYNNKKIKHIIVSPINNISLFDIEKK